MKTTPKLAIDFGTSRTKVAYFDEALRSPKLIDMGVRQAMPTVFYVPKDGDGEILVGDDAEEMLEEDPEGYVVALKMEIHKPGSKRLGIGRKIDRVELASHLFRHIKAFLEKNEPHFYQSNLDTCTLTVPVDFSDSKRNAIRKAAEMGGFTNIEIIEEPVAAAQAWLAATHQQGIDSVVVCDIGGGTTDYAVVKYRHGIFQPVPEIPTKGMEWGGDRLDEMIIDHVQDEDEDAETEEKQGFWSRIGKWKGAFKSKIRLIKERQAKRPKDVYEPKVQDTKLSVSKEVIQRCTDEFTDQVCEELQEYLEECREKLSVKHIPVLLVGGSSKLPGLEEKIRTFAGDKNVFHWTQSDYAIVLGATYSIAEIGDEINQIGQTSEGKSEVIERDEKNVQEPNSAIGTVSPDDDVVKKPLEMTERDVIPQNFAAVPSVEVSEDVVALHNYVRCEDIELLELLLGEGIDPNSRDKNGQTALHIASQEGNVKSLAVLLKHGADPLLKTSEGKTCYMLAKNEETRKILVQATMARTNDSSSIVDIPKENTNDKGAVAAGAGTLTGAVAGSLLLGPLGGVAGAYLGRAIGSAMGGGQKNKPSISNPTSIPSPGEDQQGRDEEHIRQDEALAPLVQALIVEVAQRFENRDSCYFFPGIPSGKLNNALSAYASSAVGKTALFLYDNTVWGGAKDGAVITHSTIYVHNMSAQPKAIRIANIRSISVEKGMLGAFDRIIINGEPFIEISTGNRQLVISLMTELGNLSRQIKQS